MLKSGVAKRKSSWKRNQASIQAVAEDMSSLRSDETIIEASKKHDSQTNDIAQRTGKTTLCELLGKSQHAEKGCTKYLASRRWD